jgi:hypothetical protein
MANEDNFLTTLEKWDLSELLNQFASKPTVLITIKVEPKHTDTGLLEEKGIWIRSVWDEALRKLPGIAGHRLDWSSLLFMFEGVDWRSIESTFIDVLKSCEDERLRSFCVIDVLNGGLNEILSKLDSMLDETSHERNFGSAQRFYSRLLNGERFVVPAQE